MSDILKSPTPYFGAKSKIAPLVWQWFGRVSNFVDPFFGSNAMLLARPDFDYDNPQKETINDLDGFVSNFWRCLRNGLENEVAVYADNPVFENDLHARHMWLVNQSAEMTAKLEGDPEWCDPKAAGWWVWGMSCWIGSGFASGTGPWRIVDGRLVNVKASGVGISRQMISTAGNDKGVNRQRIQLGNGGKGQGVNAINDIYDYMESLANRMRRVRVCSGDWKRVTGKSVTWTHGVTAVFLDPPYADTAKRQSDLYRKDSETVAHAVKKWAVAEGDNPLMRIALCGYEGEHDMPDNWHTVEWSGASGYAGQRKNGTNDNRKKERIWFSPHCTQPADTGQMSLW